MKRQIQAIVLLLMVFCAKARAQWDVQFSDYTALKSYYNPAVSGTDGLLNVTGTYSMQMAGYEGGPRTIFASADMPIYFLSPRHGAGVTFMSDEIGIFNTMKISMQYAFNFKLGKKARLALGVNGALLTEKINASKIQLEQDNDQAFPKSEVKGNSFDLGAGLYFYHPLLWMGISSQHLLAPTVSLGEFNEVSIPRSYYFMAGGNIHLERTIFTLHPSFMLQTDLQSWREDIQLKASIDYAGKKLYAGIGYAPRISTTFMLGGNFHGVNIGYSYQLFTNGIGSINGSHEIVIGYQTELDLFKKGRNLHKSVRWL